VSLARGVVNTNVIVDDGAGRVGERLEQRVGVGDGQTTKLDDRVLKSPGRLSVRPRMSGVRGSVNGVLERITLIVRGDVATQGAVLGLRTGVEGELGAHALEVGVVEVGMDAVVVVFLVFALETEEVAGTN